MKIVLELDMTEVMYLREKIQEWKDKEIANRPSTMRIYAQSLADSRIGIAVKVLAAIDGSSGNV